jgi:hypothetical protein
MRTFSLVFLFSYMLHTVGIASSVVHEESNKPTTTSYTPEINNDYALGPVSDKKILMITSKVTLKEPSDVKDNYGEDFTGKTIELTEATPQPHLSPIKKVTYRVGNVLYNVTEYTVRMASGIAAAQYASFTTHMVVSNALYYLSLYATGNVIVANTVYLVSEKTLLPISTALTFYVGTRLVDILYYSGKVLVKIVQLTTDRGIKLLQDSDDTSKYIKNRLENKEQQAEMIEMSLAPAT